MIENTANTTEQAAQNPDAGERTFSQEDVNRIVSERLAKERAKAEAAAAQREQELSARELRLTARETLAEKGLPAALLDAINCTSAEALRQSVSLLESAFKEYQSSGEATKPRVTIACSTGVEHGAAPGTYDSLRSAMRLPG